MKNKVPTLTLKDLVKREDRITPGHRLCPGCGEALFIRQALLALDEPAVMAVATGCLEVSTSLFPYTAWRIPWIHCAFENAASTICGAEAAYNALKRRGKKLPRIVFIGVAGDGGTYDIGFQALSGAMERGHRMIFVCLNNEAYCNTGYQRSSATPIGAHTTTTPAGRDIPGKPQHRKNLTFIMAAHEIPYVAQTAVWRWRDVVEKFRKAAQVEGSSFVNVLCPCIPGWGINSDETLEMAQLATETCAWPLFEVEYGTKWMLNYKPKEKIPVEEWLKRQGRFAHLFKSKKGKEIIKAFQEHIDREWEFLLRLCGQA